MKMEKSFYNEIFKLKQIVRSGWKQRNVSGRLESDAEHSFSMIILALNLMSKNDLGLDELKVLKLVAFHELCEIDAGDFTPRDKISKEEKFNKEYACIQRLSKEYNYPELEEIWLEFEKGETKEAQFAKHLDKYDAILQSKIYSEQENDFTIYEEFYNHSKEMADRMEKLKK